MDKITQGSGPKAANNETGDVLPDEMEGLTLYEKKCVLINHEIDNNGMGRYQWYIWGLCGFGYMLDLMWAQAFGLVLSPLMQELGFHGNQSGNISVGTLAIHRCCIPIKRSALLTTTRSRSPPA